MEHDWKEVIDRTKPNDAGLYLIQMTKSRREHNGFYTVMNSTTIVFPTKKEEEADRITEARKYYGE